MIGKPFPPYRTVLTAEAARAYAAATDDDNPRYASSPALAPPLAVVTLSLVHGAAPILCDPELFDDPMLLLRLVHLEEDITWHCPLEQGMALVSQARLAGVQERASGEILRIEVNIGAETPGAPVQPVATVQTLMFLRGATRGARRGPVHAAAAHGPPTHKRAWTVAPDQSERYADASGDRNPIHVDDDIARASGLKARILHGLCTMAFAQRAVVAEFGGGDPARLQRLRVAFARPVYMGDTLSWEGSRGSTGAHAPETGGVPGANDRPDPFDASTDTVEFVVNNDAGRAVCTDGLAVLRSPPQ